MPKGRVPERDVQCRACGATFRSARTGKAGYYCHSAECDERRRRERIVVANVHGRYGDRAAYRERLETKRQRALMRRLLWTLKRRHRELVRAERDAYAEDARRDREREASRRRRAAALRRAWARKQREARELERLRARLARVEPLERTPVELPGWLSGGSSSERARAALATDLLAAWARYADCETAPLPEDDEIAELAIKVVRLGAGARGREVSVALAGAALARAQAFHERELRAAA